MLDGGAAAPLVIAGIENLLFHSNWFSLLVGLGFGIPLAFAVFEPRVTRWQIRFSAILFTAVGMEALVHREFAEMLLGFLIGLPAWAAEFASRGSSPYRQYAPYCYGSYVGPLLCYDIVIKLCAEKIGLEDLVPAGYFVAVAVGLLLAAEMPMVHRVYNPRVYNPMLRRDGPADGAASAQAVAIVPALIPFTFSVGLIRGFGIALLLFACGLMLLFGPAGWVAAPLLLAIIVYSLCPR